MQAFRPRPGGLHQHKKEMLMFKGFLVILVLATAFVSLSSVMSGCEDTSDEIKVKRTTTVEDMPVGEPKTVVK